MELELSGKSALVTAGSYGLGYACARNLALEGAKVVICSRSADNVAKAVASIAQDIELSKTRSSGKLGEINGFSSDLRLEEDLKEIVPRAKSFLGDIEILVICTGHPPTHPFSMASDRDWTDGLNLVLQPAITLSRAVIPQMAANKFGRLIYIGSVFGLEPEQSSVIQSTLRTGLNSFSKCIATEYASSGVTANVICPGYFDTPLCRSLSKQYAESQGKTSEEVLEQWRNIAPIKEFGDPDDLGALVTFLSSAKAKFITGTSISIDGGFLKGY
jgi:3-oxoacyl-[acyl-carrier protein] reductase